MSAKKRAYLNFIASTGYQASNLLVGLILPKIYTETFGSIYNGLNSSIAQIMSLLHVLTFGISAVSIQQMFKYIACNDNDMITAIYRETEKQYRHMGYIFLISLIPIAIIFPLAIHDNLSYKIIVTFLLFRSISSAMEYFFQAKYSVMLVAQNKSYAIYSINILLLINGTILHLSVLFTLKNIIIYQAVAVLLSLLRLVIVHTYIYHQYPFLKNSISKEYILPKSTQRKDVLISEIAGMIIDSTDLLVLSIFSGLVFASIYSIYNFVITGVANVLSSCREAVFAGIGKSYYQDTEDFNRKMSRFESIYISLCFLLYSTCILLFKPFIEIYTSKMDTNYVNKWFPLLFIIAKMLVNFRIPSIIAINTAGHFRQVKNYAVIEALINIFVSLILVNRYGIYGVIGGTIAGAAYRTPILIYYASINIIKRNSFIYVKKILKWLPLFVLCTIVSLYKPFHCSSLIHWLILAIECMIIMIIVSFIWGSLIDSEIYSEIKSLINIIKKKIGINVNNFA